MLGRMNEIIKEINKCWMIFLGEHRGFFNSPKIKTDIVDTLVEENGKGIMGTPPSVLKNIKIVEMEPSINTNTQTPVNAENIVQDTNIEDTCPLDTNVQVEDIDLREELVVAKTAPSGEATGTSEEVIKDKSPERKGESHGELFVGTSLLTIDTSLMEKKNITKMSPTELMTMAA